MPMRKLPEETVLFVVELLLSGWPSAAVADEVGVSAKTILRIASSEKLTLRRGVQVGHPGFEGAGRPKGPGKKFSKHRDEVQRLRADGHSLRVIAGLVGLRSPQQVANLLSDGEIEKFNCPK